MTTPIATYRLQFHGGMTFDRAATLVPYLQRLGVSHLYASPIFAATAGSTHGYDVTDHNAFDPALGGRKGFERLSQALKGAGLGLILDIVPNHMAASLENPWWRSVVEWGADSPFARHFDIDWRERLTLPILGRPFGEAAEAGELALVIDPDAGALALGYYQTRLPLDPRSYGAALEGIDLPLARALAEAASQASPDDSVGFHERARELIAAGDTAGLEASLSRGPAALAALHDAQPWRLTFWKEARRHLSYRRFFEVTGLVGVRVEDPVVFDDVHRTILDLVRSGRANGLRIDHVDGLADPKGYLERLRSEVGPQTYLVVEKILEHDELLPSDWPVAGTTGYEFIAALADLLVEPEGVVALDRAFGEMAGGFDIATERRAAKELMIRHNFAGELETLVRIAGELTGAGQDQLRDGLVALITAFPVYRTYADGAGLNPRDMALLDRIAAEACKTEGVDQTAIAALTELFRRVDDGRARLFATRFQQLAGPVMAKAIEDTFFYRYCALLCLNEVGGDPTRPSAGIEGFHQAMALRARTQPCGLSGTATHDTKRGEDARARLYAVSEAPDLWREGVTRWRAMNAEAVRRLEGGPAPEPSVEWMLYQGLAGVWPEDGATDPDLKERFLGFVEKSLREAKLRTRWTDTDDTYEAAVRVYAEGLLDRREFLEDFTATLRPFVAAGRLNSLTQTLLKLVAPGIPDIYGGAEGWDFSLVDPDNRRPPDFAALARSLYAESAAAEAALTSGAMKQRLVATCLSLRRRSPELFAQGEYLPLRISGSRADHAVAFVRRHREAVAVAVAPRRTLSLTQGAVLIASEAWGDTAVELPFAGSMLRDALTGSEFSGASALPLRRLFGTWPVALLTSLPAD